MTLAALTSNSSSSDDHNGANFFERVRFTGNPVANPASIVVSGAARFSILTTRLLRLEWSETGGFEERGTFAFPNRYSDPAPTFSSSISDEILTIDTGELVLRYRVNSGRFEADNLQISFQLNGQTHTWTPATPNPLNLWGTTRTLDTAAGDVNLSEGLVSRSGWAVFDDTNSVLLDKDSSWVEPRRNHDNQDWYFFGYGHDYTLALRDYMHFGGSVPLIPRFVLGAWWSRYWAYSDQDLKDLVHEFRNQELPLDVLVLDMDWHTTHGWTGYSWNRELFPDPPSFLKWVHQNGLRTTLNLHPAQGVQNFEDAYPVFAQAMGVDPATGATIPFHITDRAYAQHYFELLHHPLEKQGVDFWWMDWQQGDSSEMAGLDPLIWLNHLHFQDSKKSDLRPMLYSRWGGLGNHRYHIGFSGDTYATWEALQFQPFFTATSANVLYGWWSHDIGGHIGATDPELYARWVQYGALSPCLRLHSTKDPLAERRPWTFAPAILEATRAAFKLRYELVPYLYTWARVASDTAVALCRPMYYDYPEEESAYVARYQYMLGNDMLVAPIVHPADPTNLLATTDVWIPPGTWIEYTTSETFAGPCWVRLVGDINRIPMLVKAGSIVVLAPSAPTTDAQPKDHLILRVFNYPDHGSSFQLYEDDGTSQAYEQGQYHWTQLTASSDDEECEIYIEAVEGNCDSLPEARHWEIHLDGTRQPSSIKTKGADQSEARYEPDTQTTILNFWQNDKTKPVRITISEAEGSLTTLGSDHNSELALADVKRLLGSSFVEPAEGQTSNLLELVSKLSVEVAGRTDALARLGGPFLRVIEYSAPQEVVRQLATLIIAGPLELNDEESQQQPFTVTANWVLFRRGQKEAFVDTANSIRGSDNGLIIPSPFAVGPDDTIQTLRWSVEVKVQWGDLEQNYAYRSRTLFPAIHKWQAVVYDQEKQPDFGLSQLLDANGQLNPNLAWEAYWQDLRITRNVEDGYHIHLFSNYLERLRLGEKLAAYVVAVINSPEEREAFLEYRIAGPSEFWLNGEPVTEPEQASNVESNPSTVYKHNVSFIPSRRSNLVHLKAGPNVLVISTKPPETLHWWWLSVAVLRADASLMDDLHYDW
jgi:alpha-glucosidase